VYKFGVGNGRISPDQSKGTGRRAAGCATKELLHSSGKRQRTVLHVFAQFIPRFKTIFARDDGLGVVQRETPGAQLDDR
jgi:hypothetical protein